jgi:hypothetical protein
MKADIKLPCQRCGLTLTVPAHTPPGFAMAQCPAGHERGVIIRACADGTKYGVYRTGGPRLRYGVRMVSKRVPQDVAAWLDMAGNMDRLRELMLDNGGSGV